MARTKKTNTNPEEIKEKMGEVISETESEVQMAVQGLASVSGKLKEDVVLLDPSEIRFLVDAYYQKQDDRKTKFHQIRAIEQGGDAEYDSSQVTMLKWLASSSKNEEAQIKKLLDLWTSSNPVSNYFKHITGIGPVFSAALMAYFDVTKAHYQGNFISYAGLNDQNVQWLGQDKASKLVNSVFSEYKEKMEFLCAHFFNNFDEEDEEDLRALMGRIYKKLSKENIILMIDDSIEEAPGEYWKDMKTFIKKLDGLNFLKNEDDVVEQYEEAFGYENSSYGCAFADLCEYIAAKGSDVNDWIIREIAVRTNRKVENIQKGLNNLIASRKKKNAKATKTDLISYMARPPYNTKLKTIMYLIGDSFMKRSNNPNSLYGRLYKNRKAYEQFRNERGDYAEFAAKCLANKNFQKKEVKEIYESGKLPLGHIDMRARRWAVKIFLHHVFEIMYMDKYHKAPPLVWPIAKMDHTEYIPPEVPYSEFIKVPKEYYENYPYIFNPNGSIKPGAHVHYLGDVYYRDKFNADEVYEWDMKEYIDMIDDMLAS